MNQKEKLWKNIDYIRGFKDALEWILAQANKGTVKELIDKASELHTSVSVQHLANVQELFPSFSSLAMYYASVWPDDWEFCCRTLDSSPPPAFPSMLFKAKSLKFDTDLGHQPQRMMTLMEICRVSTC